MLRERLRTKPAVLVPAVMALLVLVFALLMSGPGSPPIAEQSPSPTASSTGSPTASSTGSPTATSSGAATPAGSSTPIAETYTLTVIMSGASNGAVRSVPAGIDCPAVSCSASFPAGTVVELTPLAEIPPAGYETIFTGWGAACAEPGCVIIMNSSKSVSATFALRPLMVVLTVTLTGEPDAFSVSTAPTREESDFVCVSGPFPTCSMSYPYGTVITLYALVRPDSTFAGWGGACSGTGVCTFTLRLPTTVTATALTAI